MPPVALVERARAPLPLPSPTSVQGDYDPIYDDVRFGFGNEFVSFVFGAAACEEPTPESSLDNDVFNLAERLDIRDDA